MPSQKSPFRTFDNETSILTKPVSLFKGAVVYCQIPIAYLSQGGFYYENVSITVESFETTVTRTKRANFNKSMLIGTVPLNPDFVPYTEVGPSGIRDVILVGNLEFQLEKWTRLDQQQVRLELLYLRRCYDVRTHVEDEADG